MGARDYSTTAASNLSVGGISLAEGMARSSVNNAMRQQLADIADLLLDIGGSNTTTGSATAYLVSLDTAPTAYADNLFFLATSHATNSGAATLNVNGAGVKDVEKIDSGAAVPLVGGDFPAGHIGIFTYSSGNNSVILLNPATAGLVGTGFGIFETLGDVVGASIPSTVNMAQTLAYDTAGDGGGAIFVRRGASEPAHAGKFQSADGDWWEINSNVLDVRMFGTVGDGTADDFAALVSASVAAEALGRSLYANEVYKVNSDLSIDTLLEFGPGGRLKPASGKTVTLSAGFTATSSQHVFDVSLGGDVWATVACPVTARNYGAVGDNATNDRVAFQHLIDCCLYFQKADACYLDGGTFFISGGPLVVGYSNAGSYYGMALIGAGHAYDESQHFPGTFLRTDWTENLIEVQGARGMKIEGLGLRGPYHDFIRDTLFGTSTPAPGAGDPYNPRNWIPGGDPDGVLTRYKMNCAIHIDPRCGVKPADVPATDVRLVVTTALNATSYENGDTVDGVVLATGNRILQAVPHDVDGWPGYPSNGVYIVQASGAPVRSTDMDAAAEFANASVHCTAGTYAGTDWVCNTASITLDTTNIDWRQFDGEIAYTDYTYPAWSGIATQYGKALSSAVTVANCTIKGFACALGVKGCNDDGNADFVRMEYVGTQYTVYTFAWGQTQARDQGAIGCNLSNARVHFSSSVIGKQNGKGHFKALNCELSACVDIVDIPNMSITGGVSLDTCCGEGIFRIGRVVSTSVVSGGFEIAGGSFGFHQQVWNQRVPRYLIDCRGAGIILSPAPCFSLLCSPLIINGNPTNCTIWAKIINPVWLSSPLGTYPPTTAETNDAILLHSTMSVLFLNERQGPWIGGGINEIYSVTTGTVRQTRTFGRHATSSVSTPIPFCASTVAPAQVSGFDNCAAPFPVALGGYGANRAPGTFTGAPVQSHRTLTLVMTTTPTLGTAQNSGFVKGSIIYEPVTGSLFVVQSLSTATITAKLLNNFAIDTLDPYSTIGTPANLYFVPTGHYTPVAGVEMTWKAGFATVTTATPDGTTDYSAQFPLGAAKMVSNTNDAMTPILQANSAVIAPVVAGTVTMEGVARATLPGPTLSGGITVTNIAQPAGIWFIPRS